MMMGNQWIKMKVQVGVVCGRNLLPSVNFMASSIRPKKQLPESGALSHKERPSKEGGL